MATFGSDLWDRFADVVGRSKQGKKTLTSLHDYFAERAALEESHSKALAKLASNAAKTWSGESGTVGKVWEALNQFTITESKLHSHVSNEFHRILVKPVQDMKDEQFKQRKKFEDQESKFTKELASLMDGHAKAHDKEQKAKKQYEEGLRAQNNLHSQGALKLAAKVPAFKQAADDADRQYKEAVDKLRSFQQTYAAKIREMLEVLHHHDEIRISTIQAGMKDLVALYEHISNDSLDARQALSADVGSVSAQQDMQAFIQANRTGQQPEPLVEYQPYILEVDERGVSTRISAQPYGGNTMANSMGTPQPVAQSQMPSQVPSQQIAGGMAAAPVAASPAPVQPVATSGGGKQVRALYAYDAVEDGELSFPEGALINVIGEDDSGWWNGEYQGRSGMFPFNYVEVLPEAAPPVQQMQAMAVSQPAPTMPASSAAVLDQVVAEFAYAAQEAGELSFPEGAIIAVTEKDDSGWWTGTYNGQSGQFPSNYTKPL